MIWSFMSVLGLWADIQNTSGNLDEDQDDYMSFNLRDASDPGRAGFQEHSIKV